MLLGTAELPDVRRDRSTTVMFGMSMNCQPTRKDSALVQDFYRVDYMRVNNLGRCR